MKTEEVEREKEQWNSWLATPISFYGKVIDEKGSVVPAAKVNISFADRVWQGNTKEQETTDERGGFYASGHGISIVVMASKEGYYSLKQSDGVFNYSAAAGQLDTHADPTNPAIFILRKMGKTEPLIKVEKDFRISTNGTPVEVDLATGRATKDAAQAIEVEAWTNDAGHQQNSNQPYDWRCRVSVPGGGLVQRTDEFAFEAPEDGYQTSDEIDMPATDNPQWRSQVSKNYFLKLGSGNYARVDFTMTAGGEHFFTVVSYLNPSGSPNLEAGQPKPGAAP